MSETTDVLYLTRGRLEFTKATLPALIENTDWSLVNEFIVYNDATPELDNATATYVDGVLRSGALDALQFGGMRQTNLRSPVAVMAHFLARTKAKRFAKIDNDIVVCPGWLNALSDVMDSYPELELLGMEPGRGGSYPTVGPNVRYGYNDARHIGGVGLMQTRAFTTRPPPIPDGFFGFTEWQHTHDPVKGWIAPDLRIFALDLLPFEPWRSLVKTYQRTPGLQRDWPKYEPEMNWHWDWWLK
jgi:hypothetical protein